jgi:hypothetical protein
LPVLRTVQLQSSVERLRTNTKATTIVMLPA